MNFYDACKNGDLLIAQQLFKENPNIDISIGDEYAFTGACANGHLLVIKWLYEIKHDIDISIDNEYSFRWACSNGHITIAKWLYEIKPDINISANNDFAFQEVCIKGKIDIAQWLVDINSNYRLNVSNGKINYYKILVPIPILNEIIYILNKEICFICSVNETDIITNCKHIFCTSCITEWYNQNRACPYCRGFIYSFNKVFKFC
jgi:ankyrin repeat protein